MARRGRSPSPSRAAPRPVRRAPAPQQTKPVPVAQPQTPMVAPQPQQPGMFAQMATTAAGVAVGSAVGHTLGHAMTGAFGGGSSSEVAPAAEVPAASSQAQQQTSPCQYEFKQFLECTQNQTDISLCQGFNEVYRQCQQAQGYAPQQY